MKLKIKRLHKDAVIPAKAYEDDAGFDLTAIEASLKGNRLTYHTGLTVEIPKGYVGFIFARSSIYKKDLRLANSVGVIDSGYTGEILVKFVCDNLNNSYKIGDRVAQLVIMPISQPVIEVVEELTDTSRGEKGFGSSGA